MSALVETEVGTIAPDWKVAALDNVCEPPQYGYTASAEEKGNVRFLRITDITDSGVKWPTVPYCDCPRELLDKYRLASGDIVFARIGATTGKSYLIANPPPAVFASYLIRVRAKREIDPAFLSQFFRSVAYWRQVDAQKNANLKKGVSGSLLKTLLVPVPPLAEQRKIAAVLGLVQRAIEQQERLIALTTELKKALLHKLFTEGLRGEPQKQTEIGPVPESWEIVRLGEICALGTGTTPSTARPEYYNGDVPFVKTADIANNRITISHTNVSNEAVKDCGLKLYPPGTVFMAMYGQGKTRGQVSLLEISAATSQNAAAIQPSTEINSEFLWQYLMSRYQVLRGSGALGHISHLNLGYVRDFQLPKPPLVVQREIAEILRTIDSRLALIESRKRLLNDLFRTLLYQLMTAQLRVNELKLDDLEATGTE